MNSKAIPNSSPIIRVCRKRTADPHSALVLNLKRRKADPLIFSLFQTSNVPELVADSQPVIDFKHKTPVAVHVENEMDPQNPLAFANDSINEVGGPEPRPAIPDDVITVNGQPMVSSQQEPVEFVFDFYKISRGILEENVADTTSDDWEMRFATRDEELLYGDDESESDNGCREDDDDENEEDNWRNEYPDENEDGSDYDEGELIYDDDYQDRGDPDDDDGIRLRLQRFGIEEYDVDDEADEDD